MDNAAAPYVKAIAIVEQNNGDGIYPPSSSNLSYQNYPPYPAEWRRLESIDFPANAPARALARQARSISHANWAAIDPQTSGMLYLNPLRGLCNILADAALWQHEQHDDAAAVETIRDLLRVADAVKDMQNSGSCLLTAVAMQDDALESLEIVTSNVALTDDPHNPKQLQKTVARELINQLMNHPDAKTQAADFNRLYAADMKNEPASVPPSIIRIIRYATVERDLAAMSLACHLYRLKTGQWPKSINDMRSSLPHFPVDPFGDGNQTLGYALLKAVLSHGSDRPLVYSHYQTNHGLFFRLDQPQYSGCLNDGNQVRDVSSWSPSGKIHPVPTTQPLN